MKFKNRHWHTQEAEEAAKNLEEISSMIDDGDPRADSLVLRVAALLVKLDDIAGDVPNKTNK